MVSNVSSLRTIVCPTGTIAEAGRVVSNIQHSGRPGTSYYA